MKTFAVLLPMKDEELTKKYRPAHLEFLERMHEEKKVVLYGRFADGTGGLVIYQAEDQGEVETWVKKDPYVLHGAREYEIHQWELGTPIRC
jgi:uncharacterized protein YciI